MSVQFEGAQILPDLTGNDQKIVADEGSQDNDDLYSWEKYQIFINRFLDE